MKLPCSALIAVLLALLINPLSAAAVRKSGYEPGEAGPNHRVWKSLWTVEDEGETIAEEHAYVQLESGLNRWSAAEGRWVETRVQLQPRPDGGAASLETAYQVIFAGRTADPEGIVDLQMPWPDQKRMRTRFFGVVYHDPTRGTVLIGGSKESRMQILGPAQVAYVDIVDTLEASLVFTIQRGSFEQDLVLTRQLPRPDHDQIQLDPETTNVEIWSELLELPAHVATTRDLRGRSVRESGRTDLHLDFGSMTIVNGRAFRSRDQNGQPQDAIPVNKEIIQMDGRIFLVESLPYRIIGPQLAHLPALGKVEVPPERRHYVKLDKGKRAIPNLALHKVQGVEVAQRFERPDLARGYTIDYVSLVTSSNVTLKGDTTYYVSGSAYLGGSQTVIEGGVVVKFATNSSVSVTVTSPLLCKTSAYRPATFTTVCDNSIGETILSGTPAQYNGSGLVLDSYSSGCDYSVSHVRFRYAGSRGIRFYGGYEHTLKHAQFVNCASAIEVYDSDLYLGNVLASDSYDLFTLATAVLSAEHLTAHRIGNFGSDAYTSNLPYLKNCLLVQFTNSPSAYYTGTNNVELSSGSAIFDVVGAGHHYLLSNSPYRNSALVANISHEISGMTTRSPTVLSSLTYATNSVWPPRMLQDDGPQDLGYHYPVLDFAVNTISVTNATLALEPGTAVASFGGHAFYLKSHSKFLCVGNPELPNQIVRFSAVQEQATNWGDVTWTPSLVLPRNDGAVAPIIVIQQTESGGPAGFGRHIYSDNATYRASSISLRDSQFHNGEIRLSGSSATAVNLVNNLLDRVNTQYLDYMATTNYNNLYRGLQLTLTRQATAGSWIFYDNAFDAATITTNSQAVTHGFNGYLNGTSPRLLPNHTGDVVVASFTFASGPLGDDYFSSTNLIDRGSRNATNAGLFHYTTVTSQAKETNSVVDIGYHYVAGRNYFQASDGFSAVQGNSGWRYLYASTAQGLPDGTLPTYGLLYGSYRWMGSADYWTMVGSNWQHPGSTYDSVRAFVVPFDGTVDITSTASDGQYCGGNNGVLIRILRNEDPIISWTSVGEGVSGVSMNYSSLQVVKGDLIHFQENDNNGNSCDIVTWDPRITYQDPAMARHPSDVDGDGIADYVEDSDGDGVQGSADGAGDLDWDGVIDREDGRRVNPLVGRIQISVEKPVNSSYIR